MMKTLESTGLRFLALVMLCPLLPIVDLSAAPLSYSKVESLRRSGDAEQARDQVTNEGFSETDAGPGLIELAELFRESGAYGDAAKIARFAVERFGADNLAILGNGRRILKELGHGAEAQALLRQINELAIARKKGKDIFAPEELVVLGEIASESRVDPVKIFAQFYKPALKKNPKLLAGYLASADLAMRNKDYQYSAELLKDGLKKYGKHPELHSRLAVTYYESGMFINAGEEVEKALAINPNHIRSLLINVSRATYTESFSESDAVFEKIFAIDPWHPQARALEAVKMHHRKKFDLAAEARNKALKVWPESPYVDYWIGSMLGRMLLLDEAIPFLQTAYEIDANLIEAKAELALVYLRKGNEKKGWALINEVQQEDPYNILAFNYTELKQFIDSMVTIETPHFKVRMPDKDNQIYGDRVMEILNRARDEMTVRYGHEPEQATIIDFFPQTQDFNIRLAGIPGGLGILGACFGDVITMQSAGGVGMLGNNWEETLWHEYAHTVTLGATSQRIPRWLTEGCSVHEESLLGPNHRRRLSQNFQPHFANGQLIPFDKLNENFTKGNMMLAYFQSGRMVDYLVEKHGYEKLRAVLKALNSGIPMKEAFESHIEPVADFETAFAEVARLEAVSLAPNLDWQMPENPAVLKRDTQALADYLVENPNNLWALKLQCAGYTRTKQWEKLRQTANHLLALHPEDGENDCARYYLSLYARFKNDIDTERQLLSEWLPLSSNAVYAYERLLEIDSKRSEWGSVLKHGQSLVGVQPLTHVPHRGMASAFEALNQPDFAIKSYRKLLLTDLINPARTHYRLGALHEKKDPVVSKRHALDAISESPRYRDAHLLLRRLSGKCSCGKH